MIVLDTPRCQDRYRLRIYDITTGHLGAALAERARHKVPLPVDMHNRRACGKIGSRIFYWLSFILARY